MPAQFTTIQIRRTTDSGVEDITLTDGSNYYLQNEGWALNIADVSRSTLATRGPYTLVEERIRLNISKDQVSTTTTVLQNLRRLKNALVQARDWKEQRTDNPVLFRVQLQGSERDFLEAEIEDGEVITNPGFSDLLMVDEIEQIEVSIIRRGDLLGAEQAQLGDVPYTTSAEIEKFLLFDQENDSPTDIIIESLQDNIGYSAHPLNGVLIVGERIGLIAATNFNGTLGWSQVSDAANLAVGGNVTRYTPPDTNKNVSNLGSFLGSAQSYRHLGCFAVVKNNSATTTFTLSWQMQLGVDPLEGPPVIIEPNQQRAQVVYMGSLISEPEFGFPTFTCQADAASGSLDIDCLVFFDRDRTHVLRHGDLGLRTGLGPVVLDARLEWRQRRRERPTPSLLVLNDQGAGFRPVYQPSYEGPLSLHTKADLFKIIWLMPWGPRWKLPVPNNTAQAAIIRVAVTRRNSYLVPE